MTYKIGEIYKEDIKNYENLIPEYSWAEVKSKGDKEKCWIVMHEREVYYVTKFVEEHPGG